MTYLVPGVILILHGNISTIPSTLPPSPLSPQSTITIQRPDSREHRYESTGRLRRLGVEKICHMKIDASCMPTKSLNAETSSLGSHARSLFLSTHTHPSAHSSLSLTHTYTTRSFSLLLTHTQREK